MNQFLLKTFSDWLKNLLSQYALSTHTHNKTFLKLFWSSPSIASVPIPTVQPVEMNQTSSNTFRSQQHILAEWGELCGGYINQLSKYSTSVCLCPCVCVTDIDECEDRPCLNNASCVQGTGSFTCVCVPGYTGVLCETGERGFSQSSLQGNIFYCFLHQTQSFGRCVCPKSFPVQLDKWVMPE